MRFFAILLLLGLIYFSAGALEIAQNQQVHAGFCPMHAMMCAIYCPPTTLLSLTPKQVGGCTTDTNCASDEKCCRPACGCTNRCTKALDKAGFQKFPQ